MFKEGQTITEDAPLLEVETDKAAVEIPSPCSGTISTVHVKEKQLVHVGDVMITFNTENPEKAQTETTVKVRSSPSVRKLARTLGVDISSIAGSGVCGRGYSPRC